MNEVDGFLIGYPISVGVKLERKNGRPFTNVSHKVCWHSPDGFEWGYSGSGPADLALNILEAYAPRIKKPKGGWVLCRTGKCTKMSADLHQKFKAEVIVHVPKGGGFIAAEKIIGWIDENWDGI